MDDESQKVIRGMLGLIEQAYFDVHAYWTVITAEAPHLRPLVEYLQRGEQHRTSVHARFEAAYAAVEDRDASRLEEILKMTLADLDAATPN